MVNKYFKLFLLFILLGMTIAFQEQNLFFVLIITIIYFLITLLNKIINKNKKETTIPETKYHKTKYIAIALSIVVFVINFFLYRNTLPIKENITLSLIMFIINLLITYPINPSIFTNKDNIYNLSCTKTIISETIPSLADLIFLNNMGIDLIIFNKKALPKHLSIYFKEVSTTNIKKNKGNLYITKYIKEDIKKLTTEDSIFTKDLTDTLYTIKESRGIVDNLIRAIKINDIISYSLSFLIIVPLLYGFPYLFNNNLLLLLAIIISIINNYLLPKVSYDYDIYRRLPRSKKDSIFTKQEILFDIFSIIAIVICISTIYMATVSKGAALFGASSICLNIFFLLYLMLILIHYSESLAIINMFKIFTNIYFFIIVLLLILLTILIKNIPLIDIKSIGFINYRTTIILAIICTVWYDLTKIARYLKNRKKEHYVETN